MTSYDKIQTFLEKTTDLELLLPPPVLTTIKNIFFLEEERVVILYNNSEIILEEFFKRIYSIGFTRQGEVQFKDDVIPYMFSEKHISMNLTKESMLYLKQLANQKTMLEKNMIYCIYGLSTNNMHLQLQLKHIVEQSMNCKFILITRTLGQIHPLLQSISYKFNLHFPFENVKTWVQHNTAYHAYLPNLEKLYHKYCNDFINLFIHISCKIEKPAIDAAIEKFVTENIHEKNMLTKLLNARDIAYKLFHLNVNFSYIMKIILEMVDESCKPNIIDITARADYESTISKKDILVYEAFFVQVLEHAKLPVVVKKKIVRKMANLSIHD